MNREIKFRGKTLGYDPATMTRWMHGCYYQELRQGEIHHLITDGSLTFEVDPDTVGQFTGLCDAGGKEICEGDILMCIGQRADNKNRVYFRAVSFRKGGFYMSDAEYGLSSPLSNHVVNGKVNWEVIGNIHYNPDLMKGGEQ